MKHQFSYTLRRSSVLAAACIMLTAGIPASAETVANGGTHYATPSWDQTLPASTRFIVLSNFNGKAVLDRETGFGVEVGHRATTMGTAWSIATMR